MDVLTTNVIRELDFLKEQKCTSAASQMVNCHI